MAERHDLRAEALAAVRASVPTWSPPEGVLDLDGVRWRPDLVAANGRVLHAFFDDLADPWRRRLTAAHEAGLTTAVAFPPEALTLPALEFLQSIDASIVLLDVSLSGEFDVREFRSVAHLVAEYELALGRDGLAALGLARLDQALNATTNDHKGRYFEEVLLLLFSQVSFFVVMESRYVNGTEEIDVVLGNRGTGPVQGMIGGPFVLVSAKNRADPVGAPEVRALWGNMAKRRGRCQLGILCAARQLASTATTERASATTDPTLAVGLLDGPALRELLRSPKLDEDMEAVIREAVLG